MFSYHFGTSASESRTSVNVTVLSLVSIQIRAECADVGVVSTTRMMFIPSSTSREEPSMLWNVRPLPTPNSMYTCSGSGWNSSTESRTRSM